MKKKILFFDPYSIALKESKPQRFNYFLSVLFIFFSHWSLSQQEFLLPHKTIDATEEAILDAKFEEYTVFELNTSILRNYVKSQGESASFALNIGGTEIWNLSIEENEIRSEGFVTITTTENGNKIDKKGDCVTYKGTVGGDPQKPVRLVIAENYFGGFVTTQVGIVMIESLNNYLTEQEGNSKSFIAYEKSKAIGSTMTCGVDESPILPNPLLEPREGTTYPYCSGYYPEWVDKPRFLELAAETDCDFIVKHGDNALNVLLKMVNDADGLYTRAVNLRIILVYVHFWGDASNCNDAYSGYDSRDVWYDLQAYWNLNQQHIHRDHVHYFSGRNMTPDGVAASEATCGMDNVLNQNQSIYWLDSYSISDDAGGDVLMHELGHALGMRHICECTLMLGPAQSFWTDPCNITCADPSTEISATNHEYLCRFLNSWNNIYNRPQDICLVEPPAYNYNFEVILSIEEIILNDIDPFVCLGDELTFTFYNSFDDLGHTWGLGPNLNLIEGDLEEQTIKVETLNYGPTYVEVTFYYYGGAVTFVKEFGVVPPGGIPGSNSFTPLFGMNNPMEYEVFFGNVYGAEFYNYNYTIYNQYGQQIAANSGTTPDLNPFIILDWNTCMVVDFVPENICGLSNETFNVVVCPPGFNGVPPNPLIVEEEGNIQTIKGGCYLSKFRDNSTINFSNKFAKEEPKTFQVYPNPASDLITLYIPEHLKVYQLKIRDVHGKNLFIKDLISKEKLEISTHLLENGIYFIVGVSEKAIVSQKMIIDR